MQLGWYFCHFTLTVYSKGSWRPLPPKKWPHFPFLSQPKCIYTMFPADFELEFSLVQSQLEEACLRRKFNVSQEIQQLLQAWHTFVPQPDYFLPQFKNPCWYAHVNVSKDTQSKLTSWEADDLMKMKKRYTRHEAAFLVTSAISSEHQRRQSHSR